MNRIHPRSVPSTFILALFSVFLIANSVLVVHGQRRSREDLLKDAGRIVTAAERANGETVKKVQAGADRKLIVEAQNSSYEPTL